MRERPKSPQKPPKALDTVSTAKHSKGQKAEPGKSPAVFSAFHSNKGLRGRPQKIPRNWVTGRAHNLRTQLKQVWPKLSGPLLAANTEEEVNSAFEQYGQPHAGDFVPGRASDLLALIHDPKFPKRSEVQITFLADSLGGRPNLSLRSSRDICERERAREYRKSKHQIIRNEFYVECTCGYQGPALDNACRQCGAEIPVSLFGGTGKVLQSPRG